MFWKYYLVSFGVTFYTWNIHFIFRQPRQTMSSKRIIIQCPSKHVHHKLSPLYLRWFDLPLHNLLFNLLSGIFIISVQTEDDLLWDYFPTMKFFFHKTLSFYNSRKLLQWNKTFFWHYMKCLRSFTYLSHISYFNSKKYFFPLLRAKGKNMTKRELAEFPFAFLCHFSVPYPGSNLDET